MGTYIAQDIASTFDGDICIGPNGDLALANPLVTHKAAANFVLRTDYGDYAPDDSVGSNLGAFIGESNTERVHITMEWNINKALRDEIFSPTDCDTSVMAFDTDEAIAFIDVAGTYLIDGQYVQVDGDRMTYTFPYIPNGEFSLTIL